ncbi:hypothetical protein B0T19DRAFT_462647 [Cercophora scortea]|uniref:Uncharacterized protein n=1 Tax=Cercophora scortea TaxID=314031 RepID=A0AAE0IDP8_9PEZI|nr:hypothetical protein B0T19DRAFT_462647 [Cercophora scortea]
MLHAAIMNSYPKDLVAATKILFILVLSLWALLTFSLPLAVLSRRRQRVDAIPHRESCRTAPGFRQRTILISEVGTAKGLTLARAFYLCGHRVIGVDSHHLSPGRFSRALASFHRLRIPALHSQNNPANALSALRRYSHSFGKILRDEQVDIWVSCVGDDLAFSTSRVKEMVEARNTRCRCIMLESDMASKLLNPFRFIKHASNIGLAARVPETHQVISTEQVALHLFNATSMQRDPLPPRHFILKPSDTAGAYEPHVINGASYRLPQPRGKSLEEFLAEGKFATKGATESWVLQQHMRPVLQFRTHALVIRGRVALFIAAPVNKKVLEMRYYFAESPENDAYAQMLQFTKDFARGSRPAYQPMTGHLSFDFIAVDEANPAATGQNNATTTPAGKLKLYAYAGSPCVRTAVVMMSTPGTQMRAMVDAYLSVLDEPRRGNDGIYRGALPRSLATANIMHDGELTDVITPPPNPYRRFRGGYHVLNLVIRHAWEFLIVERSTRALMAFRNGLAVCRDRFRTSKEATFEDWDPMPFLVYHHLQWTWEVVRDLLLAARR